MPLDKCAKCGKEIHEFLTGRKKIDGKLYCSDCYFEELGTVIETNPIGAKN